MPAASKKGKVSLKRHDQDQNDNPNDTSMLSAHEQEPDPRYASFVKS